MASVFDLTAALKQEETRFFTGLRLGVALGSSIGGPHRQPYAALSLIESTLRRGRLVAPMLSGVSP
ncbi:MAG: hypothetical protein ACYDDA_06285 [Acidiferrobacteraceae bacterium]